MAFHQLTLDAQGGSSERPAPQDYSLCVPPPPPASPGGGVPAAGHATPAPGRTLATEPIQTFPCSMPSGARWVSAASKRRLLERSPWDMVGYVHVGDMCVTGRRPPPVLPAHRLSQQHCLQGRIRQERKGIRGSSKALLQPAQSTRHAPPRVVSPEDRAGQGPVLSAQCPLGWRRLHPSTAWSPGAGHSVQEAGLPCHTSLPGTLPLCLPQPAHRLH